jgi:AraC-like DNA-binding protein
MPRRWIQDAMTEQPSLHDLADHFGVSVTDLTHRLRQLGLTESQPATSLRNCKGEAA